MTFSLFSRAFPLPPVCVDPRRHSDPVCNQYLCKLRRFVWAARCPSNLSCTIIMLAIDNATQHVSLGLSNFPAPKVDYSLEKLSTTSESLKRIKSPACGPWVRSIPLSLTNKFRCCFLSYPNREEIAPLFSRKKKVCCEHGFRI